MSVMVVHLVIEPSAAISVMRPQEIPATGAMIGTPASMRAKQPPQIEAIEVEPLEAMISDTTRMEYGKTSSGGRIGTSERSASAPWPISRRPGPMKRPASPTENGGKL